MACIKKEKKEEKVTFEIMNNESNLKKKSFVSLSWF